MCPGIRRSQGLYMNCFSIARITKGRRENSLYLLAHERRKNVALILEIHEMFTRAECRCYVPASIADVIPRHLSRPFLKPLRAWDYPNKLPVGVQRQCLLVVCRTLRYATGLVNLSRSQNQLPLPLMPRKKHYCLELLVRAYCSIPQTPVQLDQHLNCILYIH